MGQIKKRLWFALSIGIILFLLIITGLYLEVFRGNTIGRFLAGVGAAGLALEGLLVGLFAGTKVVIIRIVRELISFFSG